jgi:hypothetical protein
MKTPEEKAEELVGKFFNRYTNRNLWGVSGIQKECAIICCEEIIKDSILVEEAHGNYYTSNKQYWKSVIEEIKKL